ncbi:Glucan 1,4-alpha-glucosidase [Candidatus Koribacter versatilis Ellin345]|uniref:Glucan 1,4-alpha-glucosidase n=1 Tax=Koribacter versatilis (strain Ellin345) TaxID=204669 RepID=Q1IMU2_KORVE|nr:glycoside hydrolase family 15 protein [Candidatus Koribacter versatilis]ABF41808.1 Glucan 1,4-alpha-glucosidase [Candidatus Koribacter versatilis Ellin345]
MDDHIEEKVAFGAPGMEPRWTRGAKDAVGTAYSTSSKVWYTLAGGCITEIYYPTIDTPQVRDVQFLVSDGETFCDEERRHMCADIDHVAEAALGYDVVSRDRSGRYTLKKTVLGDPHQNCLLVRTELLPSPQFKDKLRLFVLAAPHMGIGGWHNNAEVHEFKGRRFLVAHKDGFWMAIGATIPFLKCSVGYVGASDGWTDIKDDYAMDWEFESAPDGNVAMTGQFDLSHGTEFTMGIAFGRTLHSAVTSLINSICAPFDRVLTNFITQWARTAKRFDLIKNGLKPHNAHLFEHSVNLLLASEDKTYPGAMIASPAIPWGEDKGDDELGGYHLVWTRDMVNSASALLAVGDLGTPLRALIYLAVSQRDDGGFYQNFWINGDPYWHGVQLDEVSFPIVLAWRLWKANALNQFDPYPLVKRAAGYVIREGPYSPQERWEEAGGYSPSTLAISIAALVCAADFMSARGEPELATFVLQYADFLEQHVERWTVTTEGSLLPGIPTHYIRINPANLANGFIDENPNTGTLRMANQEPGTQYDYPSKDVVDAGFLELVRYGIRAAGSRLMEDSLRVIDAVLKVDTPQGPAWHRYNHDGFGQRDDGGSYNYWGVGRVWPLLTGERGHYELAAGRDAELYHDTMANFSHGVGLLPEQVWDSPSLPKKHIEFGGPTGAAIPLMWAHAEYLKLSRSIEDGRVFDLIEPVSDRYQSASYNPEPLEIWKLNRQIRSVPANTKVRLLASAPFQLHWSAENWATVNDSPSTKTDLGVHYVDVVIAGDPHDPLRFTFYWTAESRWEGKDYELAVEARPVEAGRKAAHGVQ